LVKKYKTCIYSFLFGTLGIFSVYRLSQYNWVRRLLGFSSINESYKSVLTIDDSDSDEDIDAQIEALSESTNNTKRQKNKRQ
jgi:hypothetical protein